jgi:hypothetical protein
MTSPSDEYKVGYGRPPLRTRWKNGQSGNPRKKPKRQESIVETVDRLLLSPVQLTIDGVTERIPALRAIVSQLQQKEIAGSARASRVLLNYKEFANQYAEKQLQLIFGEPPSLGNCDNLPEIANCSHLLCRRNASQVSAMGQPVESGQDGYCKVS